MPAPLFLGSLRRRAGPGLISSVTAMSITTQNTKTSAEFTTVPWKEVTFFLLFTMAAAWITALPMWIADVGPGDAAFLLISVGTMLTPSLGAFVTLRIFRPARGMARSTGLIPPSWRQMWGYSLLGLAYPIVAAFLALPLGLITGINELDLTQMSGVRALVAPWIELASADPAQIMLSGVLAMAVSFLIGLIPCFGEEWGWRGYLLPRLLPLGMWPTLLISGALWALWHAPLVLRGFNYDDGGIAGMVAMTVSCMLAGIVLGWLDLSSGSVWPAVVAHSSNNTFAVLITSGLGVNAATQVDPLLSQIPVWVTTALIVAVLVIRPAGSFARAHVRGRGRARVA
ncbi:CPBP family intramembrane glutamic endopeptidase [Nonomuraea sp. NPDC047897]|uniref:CPBP family intramembrane glutamic endopeptidase n=1 Tax=Nonomuraea sp. NPDC047897 TaxID=3364346 RepID=UPI0037193A01